MDARDKIKFLLKDKAVLAYKYRLNSHKVTINIIVGLVTLIKLKDDTKFITELHNNIIEAIAKISGQREGMQISSQSIGPPDDAARETAVPSEDDIVTYELGQCLTVVLSAVDAAPANVKWSIGKMESFDNAVHTASMTQGKSGLVGETSAHGRSTLTVTDTALPDEYWKMTFGSRRSGSN